MSKIIICHKCEGAGEIADYKYKGQKHVPIEVYDCGNCNGSGRLLKTVSYIPYLNKKGQKDLN